MGKASPSSLKNSSKLYECVNYLAMCSKPVVKSHLLVKAFFLV